jgi:predicted nucleic acid-binding protein
VVEFDQAATDQFGRLRSLLKRKGLAVPPMDLLIAATAVARQLTLVTHNVRHFANVPNLNVVDWLTP